MALRIWLPLNGDLDNLGCSRNINIVNNGTTIDNNGKIGKCYSFGTNKYLKINDYATEFLTYNEFSLSVWFKCTAQNTAHGGSALISGGNWNQAANLLILALGNFSSDHYSRLLVSGSGGWANGYSYNFYLNQWYHVVLTSGNGAVRAYVNGELIGDTYAAFKPASLEQTWICIGNGTYTQVFHFNGLINDVRIYDHCLSALEVKEISQGLVLHYKLNGQSGGVGENLAIGTNTASISTNTFSQSNQTGGISREIVYDDGVPCVKITRDSTAQSGWKYFSYNNFLRNNIKTSTNYVVSFDIKASVDGTISFTGLLNGNATNYMTNSTSIEQNVVTKDIWSHIVLHCSTKDSFDDITIGSQVIYMSPSTSLVGVGVSYLLKNMKLEEGDIVTAWTPTLNEMGKDLTRIVDSSGYGNNGIAVNSPSVVTDSKSRYSLCTQFNGSNTYINAGTGAKIKDAITIAWWGYMDTWSSYQRAISCTEGGGWNFEPSSGKLNFAMGTGASSNTYKSCTSNTTLASLSSGWHHFVGTYDGLVSNLYIDGVLDKTLSCYTTKTPIYYHASNSIIVGAEANAGNTAAGNYFNGKLSDIRIYAAALSAEDVLTLYNTPAHIDNLGGVHGFEFVEKEISNLYDFSPIAANWVADGLTLASEETNFGQALKLTTSAANKRIYRNVSNIWTANQEYNISFYAKANANGIVCNMSRSVADFSENFTLTTEWKKYTGTIKSTTTTSGGTLSFRIVSSSGTVYINNIRLELANPNLIKVNENGIVNESNIDEINFNSNNAQFMKISNNIIGNTFIEK